MEKDTIKPHFNKLGVEAILKNEITGVLLRLELNSALHDGSVLHMRINEAHPGRERFDAREALVGEIEYTKLTIDKITDKDVSIKFGPSEAQCTLFKKTPIKSRLVSVFKNAILFDILKRHFLLHFLIGANFSLQSFPAWSSSTR